jgi:hypothetical protein
MDEVRVFGTRPVRLRECLETLLTGMGCKPVVNPVACNTMKNQSSRLNTCDQSHFSMSMRGRKSLKYRSCSRIFN